MTHELLQLLPAMPLKKDQPSSSASLVTSAELGLLPARRVMLRSYGSTTANGSGCLTLALELQQTHPEQFPCSDHTQ